MLKRLTSILLCLLLLLSLAAPALAEEENKTVTITTAQDLLDLAESCRLDSYSKDLTVVLAADIDVSDTPFAGIPIFSGTFDGAGHQITGVCITGDGSDQGFFRYLTATAVVENLQLQAQVTPGGSRNQAGTLAGQNAGVIRNCTATVELTGSSRVGGVAGVNAVTGVIESCTVDGSIFGDHFVGGIAGENLGVIRDCKNSAQINTTPQQNRVELSDITMDTLTNSEAVSTITDIGGIAGISSGVVRGCENHGAVGYKHMGYNIGGIAGTQSGFLTGCSNYGNVQGRKEVGGIVGQMEPVTVIAYSEDTLQILEGQLGTMSILVNQASTDAMAGAGQMNTQITALQDQADRAKQAVQTLLGDGETVPDADTLLAAYSSLSTALGEMPRTLDSLTATAQDTAAGLTDDLIAISGQVNAMGSTVHAASQTLGGVITDVSDQDTAEDMTGKVSACVNNGDVLADVNAGGIAGAMAMENDLDVLQDWQSTGESSANFETRIRVVLLDCENSGTVTGKKQNAGGIVGGQWLGLVKGCVNTGTVDALDGSYVGGIAGMSAGTLRQCYAKCQMHGSGYVGGIAGSAVTVTDCVSIVKLADAGERTGAILGWQEATLQQTEAPVRDNFYLVVDRDIGAIDGISYEGKAQALNLEQFSALEGLPDSFRQVSVRFVQEDGTVTELPVTLGGDLDAAKIPAIPEKDGHSGRWQGLESTQLTGILFDTSFQAVYTAYSAVIESENARDGRPILLAEGSFTAAATVTAEPSADVPTLSHGQKLVESWSIGLTEPARTVRFLLPEDVQAGKLRLLVRLENGQWQETEFTVDGSYGVFDLTQGITGFALVEEGLPYWIYIATGAAVAAAAAVLCILKKKKTKAKMQA